MKPKHYLIAFGVAVYLSIITPRTEAQLIGGYVGFGSPTVYTYGAPVVAPGPMMAAPMVSGPVMAPPVVAAPVAPFTTVVTPSPWIGPRLRYYAPGWGYRSPMYPTRVVYPRSVYRVGPRWW